MTSIVRPLSKQPIPVDARSVFKGRIFEVFQWQQEQYDGSFTTFEKIVRPDTVSVLAVTTDQKIILTRQQQPSIKQEFYSPVGGIVDAGEDVETAAHRELLEETGYTSDSISLWYSFQHSYKIDWALYMFVAKDCQLTSKQNLDPGEKIDLLFVTFDEFFEIAIQDDFRDKDLSLRLLREYYRDPDMTETKKMLGLL